jgi:hypothetical protein
MNHRQSKYFLSNIEAEYGDALYYTELRWLSCDRMLKCAYELKSEIEVFVETKGNFSLSLMTVFGGMTLRLSQTSHNT